MCEFRGYVRVPQYPFAALFRFLFGGGDGLLPWCEWPVFADGLKRAADCLCYSGLTGRVGWFDGAAHRRVLAMRANGLGDVAGRDSFGAVCVVVDDCSERGLVVPAGSVCRGEPGFDVVFADGALIVAGGDGEEVDDLVGGEGFGWVHWGSSGGWEGNARTFAPSMNRVLSAWAAAVRWSVVDGLGVAGRLWGLLACRALADSTSYCVLNFAIDLMLAYQNGSVVAQSMRCSDWAS